jgi:hypothetical protein
VGLPHIRQGRFLLTGLKPPETKVHPGTKIGLYFFWSLMTHYALETGRLLSAQHFRQGLASNLHFRQFNGSKTRIVDKWRYEIARFCLNLRQVIGSNRGKELVQVTLLLLL